MIHHFYGRESGLEKALSLLASLLMLAAVIVFLVIAWKCGSGPMAAEELARIKPIVGVAAASLVGSISLWTIRLAL